jgi:D-beta-D-heptose 7-phosphate kinase/D-beta-D-heptose 1-phosphate adenosyltransferase
MAKIIVNGTFDILHRGHLSMLQYARNQGDYLLVCIDTDKRVQELKGPQRPINCQEDRKYMLESLRCVNEVQFFGSDADLIDIIKKYKPDIMVKGDDYQNRAVVGQQYIPTMLFYERTKHSTTQTIQDIIAR